MKVLFVASEAYPLMKTGGLGDIAYSLPVALHQEGSDLRLLLPGYRDLLRQLDSLRILGWLEIWGAERMHTVRLVEARHASFPFPLWIVDCPVLFDRPGNPYLQPNGYDWPDNAERFTVFARVAAALANDDLHIGWKPEVVHAHDWQTGLVPAFIDLLPLRPKRVFTIHNLAYGGHYSEQEFIRLGLPRHWWAAEGMEFYGGFSMLKAGIVYADAVTTVSPTYAREICTPAFGYGLDGLLRSRQYKLHGILNSIDDTAWNPEIDPYLAAPYSPEHIQPGKRSNKAALLSAMGLKKVQDAHLDAPLLGMVSRLVEQKGLNLILDVIPGLLEHTNVNFAVVGNGVAYYEQRLQTLAEQYPERVFIWIGYSEKLAHLLEAGADIFLMPSHFEPCGLNQMYSLRYGTPPIVFHTGGLADTVVNSGEAELRHDQATGFVFYEYSAHGLRGSIFHALRLFREPETWRALQKRGMRQNLGWGKRAREYLNLYHRYGHV